MSLRAPIGIFGGTFDPVHFGHLRPALEVLEELQLAELRLIPVHVPAHRPMPAAGGDCRLDLLKLAIAGIDGLRVDERELVRSGRSYMVDTLDSLRREFPDTPLCLILGMDSFLGLTSWHRWAELTELAHLVVLDRPGVESPAPSPTWVSTTSSTTPGAESPAWVSTKLDGELATWVSSKRVASAAALRERLAGCVYFQPITQLDISATRIRALIGAGRAPHFLLPEKVWAAIAAQSLYGWAGGPRVSTSD